MTDTDEPLPLAQMANTAIEFTIPVAHGMGIRVTDAGRGYAASEVPLEGNTNHVGIMYAGVLFTVAEVLGGVISLSTFDSSEFYPIVKDLQIRFRRPAKTTIRATASLDEETIVTTTSEAEVNGKADFVLEAELTDESGEVVATTRGIYQLRRFGS